MYDLEVLQYVSKNKYLENNQYYHTILSYILKPYIDIQMN